MGKINFSEVNRLTADLAALDSAFEGIYTDSERQIQQIRDVCRSILAKDAGESLADIPVEELKKSHAGIRVSALTDAGYTDLKKLSETPDWELAQIDGIGGKQIESIRNIITEFTKSIISHTTLKFSYDDAVSGEPGSISLITAIAAYRKSEAVRNDALAVRESLHGIAETTIPKVVIRSRVKWLFSGRAAKEQTMSAIDDMLTFFGGQFYTRIVRYLELYREAAGTGPDAALEDFRLNSAEYYILIEKLGESRISKPLIYSSIPAQLADEIDATMLDGRFFKGSLRAYQEFGAKYILHQGRVLLGDEMGLGKTVQAIAAMAHLAADPGGPGGGHFLVVCPASVLVNWCREVTKFSALNAFLLHGSNLDDAFLKWQNDGGVAVTNYESMGKIVDRINNRMRLAMLTIDEAHYIKNPEAKRTKNIHMLEDESDRILMMTGTPLENRVDEMCALIDFVRPDMSQEIRGLAHMSHVPQFREILAPLYLRRTRDQVLTELPPIEEKQQWVEMTEYDRADYIAAVTAKDFASMRKIGFLRDEPSLSAKATRLLELCDEARDEGRKAVIYSFFRETIERVSSYLGDACVGMITGDTEIAKRQLIIDNFADSPDGSVLVCQVLAGGTGLNIQSASIVIFCEPQIKPSLTNQAISRVYRMGQVRNVLVYHLLCVDSVDEAMVMRLEQKQAEFDAYADESAMAEATENLLDRDWISEFIEAENKKYLPMVI